MSEPLNITLKVSNFHLRWFFTQWTLEPWNIFLKDAMGSKFWIGLRGDWTSIWKGEERSSWLIQNKQTTSGVGNPWNWKQSEAGIVLVWKYMLSLVLPCSCVSIYDYSWSQMDVWLFFPLHTKDVLSIFSLSSCVSTLALQIQYLMIFFFIKICFPCMGIHTYGSTNCLSLT